MTSLTKTEREAAELTRLQRACERWPNYTLERLGNSDTFRVEGGTRPYTTSAHSCSCPDHANRNGIVCIHIQMVRARLLADGDAFRAARRVSVIADRSLWG